MSDAWGLGLGLLVGLAASVVAWFVGRDRLRSSLELRIAEAEGRTGRAEGSVTELRRQLEQKDSDLLGLRARLEEDQKARTAAETALEGEREKLEDEKKLLQEARVQLTDAFKALADEALKSNNEAFVALATQALGKVRAESIGDFDQRKEAIRALVDPLAESLKAYQGHVQAIESTRQEAYGDLKGLLNTVKTTQENLKRETSELVAALRRPHVRSRWGEITLRRVAELAGMVVHCDFEERPAIEGEEVRLRPDMVVHMPGDLSVPVDSKVPLDAYLDAASASTDEDKRKYLKLHAKQVRDHVEQLASKAYWDQFAKSPEFTVLFLPGEPFFSAAAEYDSALIDDAIQTRVLIATPVTLVALLKAVAYGWRQEDIAKNAREISDLGKQVYERASILWDHLSGLKVGLESAVDAFNKTVGSLELRLLPSVRRFKDLGVTVAEEIRELEPIDRVPRSLATSQDGERPEGG